MADQDRKSNGNWLYPGDDGLPVQDVGEWANEKHAILERYLDASSGPRGTFLKPKWGHPPSGAAYIDLFAGPGRARVRETSTFIPGSPLLALDHARQPFTKVILVDLDQENIAAIKARTAQHKDRVAIIQGDCNEVIDEVVKLVPEYGLNMALLDPFGIEPLHFKTIQKLASVKRMDLIIHFPTGDLKRNLANVPGYDDLVDRFLGTNTWRSLIRTTADMTRLIDVLHAQLQPFGYDQEKSRCLPVKNSKNAVMYHLVYVSKHTKGCQIWADITKNTVHGQTGWKF